MQSIVPPAPLAFDSTILNSAAQGRPSRPMKLKTHPSPPAPSTLLRLAAITHNVRTARKRRALPTMLTPRPKRMRFLIFHTAGRVLRHPRRMVFRLATTAARLPDWMDAATLFPVRL